MHHLETGPPKMAAAARDSAREARAPASHAPSWKTWRLNAAAGQALRRPGQAPARRGGGRPTCTLGQPRRCWRQRLRRRDPMTRLAVWRVAVRGVEGTRAPVVTSAWDRTPAGTPLPPPPAAMQEKGFTTTAIQTWVVKPAPHRPAAAKGFMTTTTQTRAHSSVLLRQAAASLVASTTTATRTLTHTPCLVGALRATSRVRVAAQLLQRSRIVSGRQ